MSPRSRAAASGSERTTAELHDEQQPVVSSRNDVQVFASFDVDSDGDLYELLLAQSHTPGFTFTVSGASERFAATDVWSERVRRRIRRADQVIVICGEHTCGAMGVFSELRIAQEEGTPYFLLWGRRERMCVKPAGASTSEGMYSWTLPILLDQIDRISRGTERQAAASRMKRIRSQAAT